MSEPCKFCGDREILTIGCVPWPECPTCRQPMHGPFRTADGYECHTAGCESELVVLKFRERAQFGIVDDPPVQYEGGIVWREEKDAMGTCPLLCTEWADLECRVGQAVQAPRGLFFFASIGRFKTEYEAKMFADRCLAMRFEEQIASGEATPMEGHHGSPQGFGRLCHPTLLGEEKGEDHQEVQDQEGSDGPTPGDLTITTD